ncbi:hypothetical protein SR870_04120 [Rhodopseudomonas palustris]|uniref:hypothetical protein n=1 Tax=Rhodopseudomonas palustris TaxID=1076 RepID=UPI002ACEDC5D|nr:hypothetical protein [Rhodopseudomonas palustris]WQH00491.1 hypothetical protein SR870_04120 [Rhodopseudomonas palustris]
MKRLLFPLAPRPVPVVQEGVLVQMRDALLRRFGRQQAAAVGIGAVSAPQRDEAGGAAVLEFPIRGDARLVGLAGMLAKWMAPAELEEDPFRLKLLNGRRRSLSIDRDAYVEHRAEDGSFQLVIDSVRFRLTLETSDFALLVKFVLQYCAEQGYLARSGEAAS